MSTDLRQHPDRPIEAFLEDGPVRMSDRLFDAIVEDVYRTRQQRGGMALWRYVSMKAPAFATALIVVAIAAAGTTYVLTRPNDGVIGTQPSQPAATPGPGVGANLGVAGTTLHAETFTEPFTFTMPAFPESGSTPVVGEMANGGYALSSTHWGHVSFHDDVPLPADMCRPSGSSIEDVPATPAAVGTWLESSDGLLVSSPVTLSVDGRPAMIWDVQTGGHCDTRASRAPFFGPNERHRIYAVPTGADTVLVFTWGVDWGNGTEAYLDEVNAATDELVRSMKFDQ